jgi:acetyl esterase
MLDEASRRLVAMLQQAGGPPFESLPIAALRAAIEAMTAADSPGPTIARVADFTAALPHAAISVRLYHPLPGERLPVLVYYHGGGWVAWNVQALDPVCRRLSDTGKCAVISVEYRLAPEHKYPAAVDDAYAVLSWIRAQADTLEIDPERMGVAGDSAGGNLAAVAAQLTRDRGDPPLRFQALIYPVTDATMSQPSYQEHADDATLTTAVVQHFIRTYLPADADRRDPTISPLFARDFAGLPPAIVIVAEYDPLRDEGFAYAHRLQEAGVPVQLEHFAHSMHGFVSLGGLIGQESGQQAIRLVTDAFHRHVGG